MPVNVESEIKSSSPSDRVLNFPEKDLQKLRAAIDLAAEDRVASALEEALELVNCGYEHANWLAGELYEFGGPDVTPDPEKAAFYYRQGAATVGSVLAWLGIARLNFWGKGVPQNYVEAYRCYTVVAEDSDHPVAWMMLGWMHLEGKGVEKDFVKARLCLEKAKSKGYVFANTFLGHLEKRSGRPLKALGYFTKALWLSMVTRRDDPRSQLG